MNLSQYTELKASLLAGAGAIRYAITECRKIKDFESITELYERNLKQNQDAQVMLDSYYESQKDDLR